MNLQRAYYLLAAFYSLLPLIGLVAIFSGGGTPFAVAHLALGTLAVVGLWGYILKRGFMNPRMWQPLAVVLAVMAVGQLLVVFTMPVSSVALTWMLTSSIFSVMLIIVLFHYGKRDQPLWATPVEADAAKQLTKLLDSASPLSAVHCEGEQENSVNVAKIGSQYHAKVTRRGKNGQETFERRFQHPETLVFFLEKFASVSVQDFRQTALS
ncbi:hypothetical protein [Halomonas sp. TD01]|uniref:hypothetical protein n=1 Tax=Halomonas sp. TD01 TaxID=999141 RepID=UPI000214E8C1|nr:hypothetical protein [Halomonas sp. TD01]EGP21426.1 hypothetical protein GME_01649 [Halomonas sp. TD01]CAH1043761.1 hypothetical protein HPTD01_2239 [Halomonas sp. TD01]